MRDLNLTDLELIRKEIVSLGGSLRRVKGTYTQSHDNKSQLANGAIFQAELAIETAIRHLNRAEDHIS